MINSQPLKGTPDMTTSVPTYRLEFSFDHTTQKGSFQLLDSQGGQLDREHEIKAAAMLEAVRVILEHDHDSGPGRVRGEIPTRKILAEAHALYLKLSHEDQDRNPRRYEPYHDCWEHIEAMGT